MKTPKATVARLVSRYRAQRVVNVSVVISGLLL